MDLGWAEPSRAPSFTPNDPDIITWSRLSLRLGSQTQIDIRSIFHAVEHWRSEDVI